MALNPQWSLPPWPLFGSLAVATLAVSVTSLATRDRLLHVLGVGAAAFVIAGWAAAGGHATTALLASIVISGYALAWIAVAARTGAVEFAKRGAAVALFGSELTALVAALPSERFLSSGAAAAPFVLLLAVHAANVAMLLTLTMQGRLAVGGHRRSRRPRGTRWRSGSRFTRRSGHNCWRLPPPFTRSSPPMPWSRARGCPSAASRGWLRSERRRWRSSPAATPS